MNIKKLYSVVEITCEHSRYNTVNDCVMGFIEIFEQENPGFEIINGTVEWSEESFYCLAKEL